MVYDCFQFFNELDILKIRLNVMNDVVDKFVISEATETFSGLKKPLYYEKNKEMFKEFEDKIIHVVVDDTPQGGTHERDTFQKNAVTRGLKMLRMMISLYSVIWMKFLIRRKSKKSCRISNRIKSIISHRDYSIAI